MSEGPQDSHDQAEWVLPPDFAEAVGPEVAQVLSQNEFEGAPIPFGIQFGLALSATTSRFHDPSADLQGALQEATDNITEAERRYPDSPIWDRARGIVVDELLASGHDKEAIDYLQHIVRPHSLAAKLDDVVVAVGQRQWFDIAQWISALEPARQAVVMQAVRDHLIELAPEETQTIGQYNDHLHQMGVEADPVSGWAKSMAADYPDYAWDQAVEDIQNDNAWGGMPVAMRQHTMWAFMRMVQRSDVDADTAGLVDGVVAKLDTVEDAFPKAVMLGRLRGALSLALTWGNEREQALRVASTMRNRRDWIDLSESYIRQGNEDEAIALALACPDSAAAVAILLDAKWQRQAEQATRALAAVIADDAVPAARRIGYLEVIRDRLDMMGELDNAHEYQRRIDSLKRTGKLDL